MNMQTWALINIFAMTLGFVSCTPVRFTTPNDLASKSPDGIINPNGPTPPTSQTPREITTTKTVSVLDNQLDILLVIDDSNSMLADNQRLAQRLQSFVSDLTTAGFDWQMCITLTRAQQLTDNNLDLYWGASRFWVGNSLSPQWILKPNSGNIAQIFSDTINQIGAGWAGTDDERAIKAAYWHLWNGDPAAAGNSGCYRPEAGLSVIILSDEDERSVGGDPLEQHYESELKPLEDDDLPSVYLAALQSTFGPLKRHTVNSIIVKPKDNVCMIAQDSEGSKSHFGKHYSELSQMTGGFVGNICDSDYSQNLKYFKERIVSEMASLPLECNPLGPVQVTVHPEMAFSTSIEGSQLKFTPSITAGKTITANYQCPAPSPQANAIKPNPAQGKIVHTVAKVKSRGIASAKAPAAAGGIRKSSP